MIETDKLVAEMLGVIGYAQQTLALHPESAASVQNYLRSERLRLAKVIEHHQDHTNVIDRIVVF